MTNRRTFFRGATLGLGGLYLAPFIRQLEAAGKGAAKPARVLFFVQGNGLYPAQIQPKGIERPRDADKLEDRPLTDTKPAFSLEPLAPWQEKMTIINGLSGKIARGSHGMGFAALGCWPMGKKAYGETINVAMARNLPSVFGHVGVGAMNSTSAISYDVSSAGRGKALPTILNPMMARNKFFAAGAEGDARKDFDVDSDLYDFMADDVKRMQARLDGSEKEKLDRYLEAFQSMRGRQEALAKMSAQIAKATPVMDPKVAIIGDPKSKTAPTGIFDRFEAQTDVAAGCLIAGLTNVATVTIGAGPDRSGFSCQASEVGQGNGYIPGHGIGHGGSGAGMSSTLCHELIRRKCMEKVAKLVRKLESVPEGDGTMMDNTLVIYLSDAADSHHPGCKEWPFVMIGDLGGRLRLGNRFLRFPDYGRTGHRTIANLYLSLLHAVGERKDTFGVPDFGLADLDQTGPLAEIMS